MKFLADENVPQRVIILLTNLGHDVLDAKRTYPSEPDDVLIEIAKKEHCTIITFDKDFLEPIFSQLLPSIVVLHFPKTPTSTVLPYIEKLTEFLQQETLHKPVRILVSAEQITILQQTPSM